MNDFDAVKMTSRLRPLPPSPDHQEARAWLKATAYFTCPPDNSEYYFDIYSFIANSLIQKITEIIHLNSRNTNITNRLLMLFDVPRHR